MGNLVSDAAAPATATPSDRVRERVLAAQRRLDDAYMAMRTDFIVHLGCDAETLATNVNYQQLRVRYELLRTRLVQLLAARYTEALTHDTLVVITAIQTELRGMLPSHDAFARDMTESLLNAEVAEAELVMTGATTLPTNAVVSVHAPPPRQSSVTTATAVTSSSTTSHNDICSTG